MLNKKKLTQQQLFLPIVCVLLVLASTSSTTWSRAATSMTSSRSASKRPAERPYHQHSQPRQRGGHPLHRHDAGGLRLRRNGYLRGLRHVPERLLLRHAHRGLRRLLCLQPRRVRHAHGGGPAGRSADGRSLRRLQRHAGGVSEHPAHGGHADPVVRRPRPSDCCCATT